MMAHLYRSVHVQFPKVNDWDDMAHFIDVQGKAGLGIDQRTEDRCDAYQAFGLAMGILAKRVKALLRAKKSNVRPTDRTR